jgi:hypothetical protein
MLHHEAQSKQQRPVPVALDWQSGIDVVDHGIPINGALPPELTSHAKLPRRAPSQAPAMVAAVRSTTTTTVHPLDVTNHPELATRAFTVPAVASTILTADDEPHITFKSRCYTTTDCARSRTCHSAAYIFIALVILTMILLLMAPFKPDDKTSSASPLLSTTMPVSVPLVSPTCRSSHDTCPPTNSL